MKRLICNRFAFALLVLCIMSADVTAALLGMNETLVVIVLCVCIVSVVTHDLLCRAKAENHQEKEVDAIDLEDFFKKGGFAYRWNKGDKERKKCLTLDSLLDGEETDYAELWLGNTRYYIKDTKDE